MTLADLSPLANHLWQSTLCVAAAWLLTLALRKNRAAVRYWLWLAASVKFLIPFSLLVSIGSHVGWRTAPVIVQPQWTSVIDDVGVPFTASAPVIQTVVLQASNLIPAILFCVWLCGFAVTVAFWLRCLRRVQVARRGAAPLALDLPIRVLSSRSLIEPGIFGIFRPVLLLPEGITDCLNATQLDAIFAHEMCHVRRRDNLTAAIHMMVETIFWFHPLVWWIRTRLVEERERACDEEVLKSGGDPRVYAEGILNVCKFYLESPLTCVSGVTGSDLKKRMERIMRNRVGETLAGWRRLFLTMAGVVALAGPLVFGLVNSPRIRAQSLLPPSVAPLPSFEVVSIKVNKNASVGVGRINLAQPGGHLAASNVSLKFLIIQAYQPTHLHMGPNPKGAEWIDSEHFDIEAEAEGNPTVEQKRLMIQSLLADRFKLVMHHETHQLPEYALVQSKAGKAGPQLKPHSDDTKCVEVPAGQPNPLVVPGAALQAPCGGLRVVNNDLVGQNVTMEKLAGTLSVLMDRNVVDGTRLDRTFDLTLHFQIAPPEADTSVPDPSGPPPIFTALKEQLGLKLESQTGPVDVLVIDHVEKPSENVNSPQAPAQSPQAAVVSSPSFEVVSIKPDRSGSGLVRLGGPDASRFTAANVTAKLLIEEAYNVKDFQVSGGPDWINSEKYDVDAKVEDSVAEQLQKLSRAQQLDRMRPMLQSMLADRFKLKVSHDTKQLPVYALMVAKGGAKIAEVAPPDPQINPAPPPASPTPGSKLPPIPPGGFRMGVGAGGQAFINLKAAPLSAMTDMLSVQLGRQVVDQTGLKGVYDFILRWTSDTGLNGGPLPIAPSSADPPAPALDSSGTSIFTALQEQLGLKLESTKGPVDTIVIEHIEEPSEN